MSVLGNIQSCNNCSVMIISILNGHTGNNQVRIHVYIPIYIPIYIYIYIYICVCVYVN